MPDRALRILIAPNSFKGSAKAKTVACSLKHGVTAFSRVVGVQCDVKILPICDGGTGFASILANASSPPAKLKQISCLTPTGGRRVASYAWSHPKKEAIVESAEVIGLALVPQCQRNPLHTTSAGLGALLRTVIRRRPSRILLGCGDTATADCGVGMLSALGVQFLDALGQVIHNPHGRDLSKIVDFDDTNSCLRTFDGRIDVACNLSSIAAGPNSSALIYSVQKGATPKEAETLARAFETFCGIVECKTSKRDLSQLPGSGAAGGIGFAVSAFAPVSDLRYSFEVTFDALDVDSYLEWADVVITGEGLFDQTSAGGKAPVALGLRARLHGAVTVGVVGAIESGILSSSLRSGLDVIEPFSDSQIALEHFMERFDPLARDACTRALLKAWPLIR